MRSADPSWWRPRWATTVRMVASWLLAGYLCGCLCGCISLAPVRPSPHTFIFEIAAEQAVTTTTPRASSAVLVVNKPWAAPGYDSARMAYSRAPGQLAYFANHVWADTPARMLHPLLVHALERTGAFRAVVQAPSLAARDLTLETELLRLRQVFPQADTTSVSELQVRIQLLHGDQVLASKIFTATTPCLTADPPGGVAAINQLLEKMLPQIAAYCAAKSAPNPGAIQVP